MIKGDVAHARGHCRRQDFRRLCALAEEHELDVVLWATRRGSFVLRASDGAQGSSSAQVEDASSLDAAAIAVLGQLAEAGIS